ncbi:MAG: hypothetical protein KF805_17210, partial [Phycisphaeraceae bacterium]|nr:hypothetical protein [Phycisphaeraceae bacterium]
LTQPSRAAAQPIAAFSFEMAQILATGFDRALARRGGLNLADSEHHESGALLLDRAEPSDLSPPKPSQDEGGLL